MKQILAITVLAIYFLTSALAMGGIRRSATYKQEYRRALNAGTDAAAKATAYTNEDDLSNLSFGFGVGLENSQNIRVNKEEALKWFYRIFYSNLKIQDNEAIQQSIKKYIPMKCIIEFDRLSIADVNDNWVIEKPFVINYSGNEYLFTLSNQIQDQHTLEWKKDSDIGLSKEERQELIINLIKKEIESFLNNRENMESNTYYTINLGISDLDQMHKTISGSNFIVFAEGIPLPSLNIFNPKEKLYAFSIGGSEIIRK